MSTVWFSLKKSFHCKTDSSQVHDPKSKNYLSAILTRKPGRCGCSRSIANLKDVINGGSKRHSENTVNCSPRSIGSSDFSNPITHEVILNSSKCELKITGFNGGATDDRSTFVGALTPGTPSPCGNNPQMQCFRKTPSRRTMERGDGNGIAIENSGRLGVIGKARYLCEKEFDGFSGDGAMCHKCGKQFNKLDNLEAHHLSKHAVTELMEGDSSRKIVEIICRSSWLKSDNTSGRIEKILKVHNMQKTLARFEEYRESVKSKANKLLKKHPRCLADGNELLRFYGTTIACSLGINGASSSLCISYKCSVCRIIREGFSAKRDIKDGIGVFTTSTSGRAFESIEMVEEGVETWKALIVCRVIAGRVHRPLENIKEMAGQSGFDSLAGKLGVYSNIEELYLLSPRALLPCFVVICKP